MTNIDILAEIPIEMRKQWLNNGVTKRLFIYLQSERERAIKHLKEAKGLQETGKYQGDLDRIEKTLLLQDVLKDNK